MRSKLILGIGAAALMLLGIAKTSMAQRQNETLEAQCDPSETKAVLVALAEQLPDDARLWARMGALANDLRAAAARCEGLEFTGSRDEVIGPVEIPAGLYRAVIQSRGSVSIRIEPIDGDCSASRSFFSDSVFSIFSSGTAPEGDEALFYSSGCLTFIEASFVRAPYTLRFERLN
ncbi:MAG: hypothetical protein SNJ59_17210 [Aggregatilineales bacterium]